MIAGSYSFCQYFGYLAVFFGSALMFFGMGAALVRRYLKGCPLGSEYLAMGIGIAYGIPAAYVFELINEFASHHFFPGFIP